MNLPFCRLTTTKADFGKKRIVIGFELTYNDENKDLAERLAAYIGKDAPAVELRIIPIQPQLFSTAKNILKDMDAHLEVVPRDTEAPQPTRPEDWTPEDGNNED